MATLNATGLEGRKRKLAEIDEDEGVSRKNARTDSQALVDADATVGEQVDEAMLALDGRCKEFLAVLVTNAGSHREVRRCEQKTEVWTQRCNRLQIAPHGISHVDACIAHRESRGEDASEIRQARGMLQGEMDYARDCIKYSEPAMKDLRMLQTKRNNRMYTFADMPQEVDMLACLHQRLWERFALCKAANGAVEYLERKLYKLEQSQEDECCQLDEYGRRAVQRMFDGDNPAAPSSAPQDTPETLDEQLGELYTVSKPVHLMWQELRSLVSIRLCRGPSFHHLALLLVECIDLLPKTESCMLQAALALPLFCPLQSAKLSHLLWREQSTNQRYWAPRNCSSSC